MPRREEMWSITAWVALLSVTLSIVEGHTRVVRSQVLD